VPSGLAKGARIALLLAAAACASKTPPAAETPVAGAQPLEVSDHWPRQLELPDAAATVFQPQVESWNGNALSFRIAVGLKTPAASDEIFGVVWGSARTEVDRVTRHVTLEDMALTRSSFPTLPDNGAGYLAELALELPRTRGISLDRLEASLAATRAEGATSTVSVKNDVPRILVATSPAILLPIEGAPVIRAVAGTAFERVLNTRAFFVREVGGSLWYVHVYDGWLASPALAGPYAAAATVPAALDPLARDLAEQGLVELLDGGNADPKPTLASGAPQLWVSEQPAELVVYRGDAAFEPIAGTGLRVASNTLSDVIQVAKSGETYLLISGRWYRGDDWHKGPWTFVASDQLPADFARIPADSRAGVVLASVAGTPQAREAAIENSIPQTATIPLDGGPTYTPVYDGEPQLAPIAGTPLQYVRNCGTPIIQVDANRWYALSSGIWFFAVSPGGPWVVAASVPEVVYTIPPSSPLHYVTYAHVYGATEKEAYVGYTPGYFGTVVEPHGTVVYGTGYPYDPWVGNVYYAAPATYGMMAQPVYNPAVGWAYGYGLGLTTAAVVDSWGASNAYYSSAYHGYPCCGTASANVYGQYGNTHTTGKTEYAYTPNGVSEYSSGTYKNEATGTHGSYSASQSYDPSTGQRNATADRSFDTTGGATGQAQHSGGYNYDTGRYSGTSNVSATGAGGSTVSSSGRSQGGVGEANVSEHQTSYTNANTGKSGSFDTASVGNNHYAGADGNVYKNTGDGWQKAGPQGWQKTGSEPSWASSEQHAREEGESRSQQFERGQGGGGERGGGGDYGNHFGGGGFGDRYGESRGGGGFGGRGGGGRRR